MANRLKSRAVVVGAGRDAIFALVYARAAVNAWPEGVRRSVAGHLARFVSEWAMPFPAEAVLLI